MKKELTTTNDMDMLTALRNTIAPGLTDGEFLLFAEVCKATGLNPITKEIWPIKVNGRLQPMTGINGFLRIANSHSQFDGMEVSFEWDGKQLVSCTVKVHRKDRKFPSVATAYWNEYNKPGPVWKQMPTVMLSKCAKSLAIREAFIQELGGLYTAEEMPPEFAAPKAAVEPKTVTVEPVVDDLPADWLEANNAPEAEAGSIKKAQVTYYDVTKLPERQQAKARQYLAECEAKNVFGDVWRAPIRLERLTQAITEDVTDAQTKK